MVKDKLYEYYRIRIIDKSVDGVLGIELVDKITGFVADVYVCYLPPENSVWGIDSTNFFAHLLSELYLNNAADMFLFCGDFNGRIGDLSDIIDGIDNDVPPRKVLDNVKKGHAEALMEFVRDGKLAILNGRVNPENDNFTFISSRGKSVVDYMMTPQDCIKFVDSFRIDVVSDLMTKYGAFRFLTPTCKSPDHSLLTTLITCSYDRTNPVRADGTYNDQISRSRKVYQYHDRYDEYLSSPVWQAAIQNVIAQLGRQVQQSELDIAYNDLCKNIFNELDNTVGYKIASNKLKKRYKSCKPYWNDRLSELWSTMTSSEKNFTRYRGNCQRLKN